MVAGAFPYGSGFRERPLLTLFLFVFLAWIPAELRAQQDPVALEDCLTQATGQARLEARFLHEHGP